MPRKLHTDFTKWCFICGETTPHFKKVYAGRIACKKCRDDSTTIKFEHNQKIRLQDKAIREEATKLRRQTKLKAHLEAAAIAQATRAAKRVEPRWCKHCEAITDRETGRGSLGKCKPCRTRKKAARTAALKALASPKTLSVPSAHLCDPSAPCANGHTGEWSPQGICRACTRTRLNGKNRMRSDKVAFRMWENAKQRAARDNLPFDIEPEDCAVPALCPVFGLPFVLGGGAAERMKRGPSIDKFKKELGYVKGNVFIISGMANTIKNQYSTAQVRAVADWMEKVDKLCHK